MSQGSLNGPYLYLAYASTIIDVVDGVIDIYGFADDNAIRHDFESGTSDEDIKMWMDRNRLKMNCNKTEFILIGGRQQLAKCGSNCINVNGENIPL